MDGDQVLLEQSLPDPLPAGIIIPAKPKDGRCICTKPAIRGGPYCRWSFDRTEIAPDGVVVYRMGPRAKHRKLIHVLRGSRGVA